MPLKHIDTRSARFDFWSRVLIPHIVCRFVGHHRSVSCARRIGGIWQSRCKRCGADIVRVRPTKWRGTEKLTSARTGRAH
jgi:hypothetical protein